MTLNDFIIHLNSRFRPGGSQEQDLGSYPEDLIRKLAAAVENVNKEKVLLFQKTTGLTFVPEKEPEGKVCYLNNREVRADYKFTFAPIDVLDYIYALLHSPAYREQNNEFLAKDFPWVSYPENAEVFWKLVDYGKELRLLHTQEYPDVGQPAAQFSVIGTNRVENVRFSIDDYAQPYAEEEYPDAQGAVYINDNQYFAFVPAASWELCIGGYKPAQKWLDDRKGHALSSDDIRQYRKIIITLAETGRLMKQLDDIERDYGSA